MNETWFAEIEDKVFTFVQYEMKKKHPELNCTTVVANDTPSTFPTLYIHELSPAEMGNDLDNTTINAVLSTMEIQVWTNTKETDCKKIISDAIAVMKQLRYSVSMFQNVTTLSNTQMGIARFRRVVGQGDKLY